MTSQPFRREDITGIQAHLRDMADPVLVAQQLGVPMSRLEARQVQDPGKTPRETVNDFFLKP